ncbi:FecCD family ABC transporter permease [Paenibacillus physcomitrellae]|uniref:Iron ABC transporter permease n=1 Tax=Paenibacillus physcomitrellae TaxID=1619311 RepID=A0ABQ1FUH9_9BACL|nr:iron ABC transporter permease [Paenibacillus physcomitrellae]GGA30085.1 iron ABC transporter permease [Paenibacillus physcomitrellae]
MRNPSRKRYGSLLLLFAGLILIVFYLSLTNGSFDLSIKDIIYSLFRIHRVAEYDLILFEFRLPRIAASLLVGFGLGIAGTVVQGVTRNGLADPGILGINAGAGAAIVLFMFLSQGKVVSGGLSSALAVPAFGWLGGLIAAVLIYTFARRNGTLDSQQMILAGLAVGSGLGAATLYLSLKMNPQDFEMAVVWLAGSIWNSNWTYILCMLPWLLVLIPFIIRRAYLLDLYQLGEPAAKGLGVRVEREKNILLLCSIGLIGACVAVSGNIGFVGLLAPHIAKRLAGHRHVRALPLAGLIGALLVLAADAVAKMVFSPVELPVGIVISIIGVPYFVYLLYMEKRRL